MKWFWWVGSIIIVIVLIFSISKLFSGTPTAVQTISDPSTLPGLETGTVPWAPEIDHLAARLKAIGLPALPQEGTAMHIHQHLDIFIHGATVPVPADIGINANAGFISPIHTHDGTGIMHVESPTVTTYTLGQFFDIWGVKFTAQCIGGYCNNSTNNLKVYVNGSLYAGDPRQIVLQNHEEIAIVYGTAKEMPNPVPGTYAFPAGY